MDKSKYGRIISQMIKDTSKGIIKWIPVTKQNIELGGDGKVIDVAYCVDINKKTFQGYFYADI